MAELLLRRGHRVQAMTRDPDSAAARALAAEGAEIVRGDFDDPAGLESAVSGADVVIASGTAHKSGPDGEARHGINLAEAVGSAGATRLIYISGAGAEGPTGVPVFESKHAVEERIRSLGIRHTIIAPVYLMENALNQWNLPSLRAGRFPLPLPADRKLPQVAIADIAAVAAHVAENAGHLDGKRLAIASDELTGAEAAAALSRVADRSFEFERVPLASLNPPMRLLFEWLDEVGESADVAGLRRNQPEIGWHTFEQWAATQDWPR